MISRTKEIRAGINAYILMESMRKEIYIPIDEAVIQQTLRVTS